VLYREGPQLESLVFEQNAWRDDVIPDVQGGLARAEDNSHQVSDSLQRPGPAVDLHLINGFPPAKGGSQAAQAEDMIQVAVSEQDAVQSFEPQTAAQDLALRTLTAVDEKSVLTVQQDGCGKSALD
jgi:hypothetical protein